MEVGLTLSFAFATLERRASSDCRTTFGNAHGALGQRRVQLWLRQHARRARHDGRRDVDARGGGSIIVGPAAIVRFHWMAEMMTDGKKVANSLHILMNWQKQGDEWKLLSRSATKL